MGLTRSRVNLNDIRDIPISMPTINKQNQFADKVAKIEKLIEKQKETKKKLDQLFNSLSYKYFN